MRKHLLLRRLASRSKVWPWLIQWTSRVPTTDTQLEVLTKPTREMTSANNTGKNGLAQLVLGCSKGHAMKLYKVDQKDDDDDEDELDCDGCDQEIKNVKKALYCVKCDFHLCKKCQKNWQIKVDPSEALSQPPELIFSAHGDALNTNVLKLVPGSSEYLYFGHIDNYTGVYSMLGAFFSGKLPQERVHCKITYGEEGESPSGVEFEGAREVMKRLNPQDWIFVIDVTGIQSRALTPENIARAAELTGHVVFEKVKRNKTVIAFLVQTLGLPTQIDGKPLDQCDELLLSDLPAGEEGKVDRNYTYEMWHECEDPQASEDETDVYRLGHENVVFLGMPSSGGQVGDLKSSGDYNDGAVFCWRKDLEAMTQVVIDLSRAFVLSK
eukprot:TRINITY_DN58599_c0_g1_i10.p1 TRINITY_DN58599_c0_g1~~TRINITY_DN58599_c0_g1_i10.p1  ORF type:complete len:381 (-),score=82.90 TRINITY_DN58599_c0_g1_i10:81-1223(-)